MHIRVNDTWEFSGTFVEIVEAMRSSTDFDPQKPLRAYVDWVVEKALDIEGVILFVRGPDDEARAASLIEGLLENGLAERLDSEHVEAALEQAV